MILMLRKAKSRSKTTATIKILFGEQLDSLQPAGELKIPLNKCDRALKALAEAYAAERNWTFQNGAVTCVATPPEKIVVFVEGIDNPIRDISTAPKDREIELFYILQAPPLVGRWSTGWKIWVYEKFDTFKENNDLQPKAWREIEA